MCSAVCAKAAAYRLLGGYPEYRSKLKRNSLSQRDGSTPVSSDQCPWRRRKKKGGAMIARTFELFRHMSLLAISGALLPTWVAAQEQEGVEEIVVIGSNIGSTLKAEEQATPITVYSALEIEASGTDSLSDFLLKDPAFTAPNGSQDGRSQGGSATQSLNLRGLGDRYTLTLVNGRRLNANGPGNLLLIPPGAIERVEILKAGASAIYGSDAVAGAVNLVLKKDYEGMLVQGGYGDVTGGDALTRHLAVSTGVASDRSRLFMAAAYYKRDPLDEDARAITFSEDMREWGGFDGRSSSTIPARFTIPGMGTLILDTSRFGPGTYSLDPNDYIPYVPERDNHERLGSAIAGSERKQFYGSVEYDVGRSLTIFGEGMYALLTGSGVNSTKIPRLDDPRIGGVPATNPWNPFGIPVGVSSPFPVRVMEKGPLVFAIDSRVARLVGGVRATLGEIEIESALSYYETRTGNWSPRHISKSGLREALNRPGPDAFNPFCNLCNTDEQLAGVIVSAEHNRTLTTGRMADLRMSGPLFDLPTGTVQFAAGVEYREERLAQTADASHVQGDLADSGVFEPVDLDRSLTSVFGELRIPLLEGSGLEHPVELTLAGRYESYSDFGDTFRPLTSLRWEAIENTLTLRASYSRSFRAPYLQEMHDRVSSSQITLIDPLTDEPVEVEFRRGGNPNLDPEYGETFNIGGFWTPEFAPGLRLTADYFDIDQSGLVIAPSAQLVFNGQAPGNVYRDGRARGADEDILIEGPLANAAGRKVHGIDLGALYNLTTPRLGDFDFNLTASYLLKFEVDTGEGLGFIDYAGEYSLAEGNNGVRALPHWKAKLNVSWSPREALDVAVAANYLGSYLQERATATPPFSAENPGAVPSHLTFDLRAAYEFDIGGSQDQSLKLAIGAENVLNRMPPFVRSQNGLDRNVYSVRGRFLYANFAWRF